MLDDYLSAPNGTRLPPERQLAQELGVTRNEIRKALARYELEGRIVRHVGRGTFIRKPQVPAAAEIAALQRVTRPREAMEARFVIEPEVARLAAHNATNAQVEQLLELANQIRQSSSWTAYKIADGQFHQLIAQSSGNTLLCALSQIVDEVRRSVVWAKLDTNSDRPPPNYTSFAEHQAIVDAIAARDSAGAADAMRRHLLTTSNRLLQ